MIDVVIGSAYGDEGKGATTNALSTPESVVVRFNGGAQAGHTVEHNGIRHIFSHFGSGVLKGAKTFLSKNFVCNPVLFRKELIELDKFGIVPQTFIAPDCYVTTPFDMVINVLLERKRGKDRHGSVGVGFGETIERSERFNKPVFMAQDLFSYDVTGRRVAEQKLREILNDWFPKRLEELEIEDLDGFDIQGTHLLHFLDDCELMAREVKYCNDWQELGDHFVFEGAQGLMIDQDSPDFPHVSRSHTGLKNVMELIGNQKATVHYVTRAYTTRHGRGPFPHELDEQPYEGIIDKTNVFNKHQEGLRFSYLNLDTIFGAIKRDMDYGNKKLNYQLSITCLDQLPEDECFVIHDNVKKEMTRAELPVYVQRAFWKIRK